MIDVIVSTFGNSTAHTYSKDLVSFSVNCLNPTNFAQDMSLNLRPVGYLNIEQCGLYSVK